MGVVQNFEDMLGQTQNHCLYNSVILCSAIPLKIIFVVVIEFDGTVLNWYDNSIILKPQFYFMFLYPKCFKY
jgi:hypothetical protein